MNNPVQNRYNPFSSITPPSTIHGFDCFAVNVMGQGISPSLNGTFSPNIASLVGGNLCASYPGISSTMINASQSGSVTLTVPSGAARYIQILGFPRTDMGCRNDKPWTDVVNETGSITNFISSHFGGIFEVGSSVRDLFRDEQVSIQSSYNANNPRDLLNCIDGPGPEEFPNLKFWYIADEFQDGYNNGNTIATNWRNASPSLSNYPQLSPTSTPTYTFPGIGGLPSVRFGVGKFFSNNSVVVGTISGGLSLFVVVKTGGTVTAEAIFGFASNGAYTSDFFRLDTDGTNKFNFRMDGNSTMATVIAPTVVQTNTTYLVTASWDPFGDVMVEANQGIGGNTVPNGGNNSVAIGATGIVSIGETIGTEWSGDISEVVVYDRVLSSSERSQVKSYLANKYGMFTN